MKNTFLCILFLVNSFHTNKGQELAKVFKEDARTIISRLCHYHTEFNVAQHEAMTLTTYITNLSLTDNWKGSTHQFLSHFKEKLCLLGSLVPETDKISETIRITFLQRAVLKNNDLRHVHVLDSVWQSKIGSTGKFTFEVYYDLLWNAAYQHDLKNAAGHKKMQGFISQQVDSFDESDPDPGEDTYLIKKRLILPNIQLFNLPSILQNVSSLPSFLSLINFGETFLWLRRSFSLNKKVKVCNP